MTNFFAEWKKNWSFFLLLNDFPINFRLFWSPFSAMKEKKPRFLRLLYLKSQHRCDILEKNVSNLSFTVYSLFKITSKNSRGCLIIIRTGTLHCTSKTIAPRIKSQARGQIYWSRALKWGIVPLCNSKSAGDMIKNKKYHFFKFLHF